MMIKILTQKQPPANKKIESEMRTKVQLFLMFADENTALSTVSGYDQSEFYLVRNPETEERELYKSRDSDSDQYDCDYAAETKFSPDQSPEMETPIKVGDAVMKEIFPLKMTYSEAGVALLTPAVLLEGNKSDLPLSLENKHVQPTVAPHDASIAQKVLTPACVLSPSGGVKLDAPGQPGPSYPKITLPPPPGLLPPPPGFAQLTQTNEAGPMQNSSFVGNVNNFGMIAQTGPVETLNPFANVVPSLFHEFGASLNRPSHMNVNEGIRNQYQHTLGLGSNINSIISSNQSLDQLASSDAFGLVLPQQADLDDKSESIMKFLFEGNDSSPSKAKSQSTNDTPLHTMNPFAK